MIRREDVKAHKDDVEVIELAEKTVEEEHKGGEFSSDGTEVESGTHDEVDNDDGWIEVRKKRKSVKVHNQEGERKNDDKMFVKSEKVNLGILYNDILGDITNNRKKD